MMKNPLILWITDPWDTLSYNNDTTLRLMDEAHKMGIRTYWTSSDLILKTQSNTRLNVQMWPRTSTKSIEMEPSEFHHLHYRVDPPVDFNYISLIDQIIERGATPAQILNPPVLIKTQSEKVPPIELKAFAPLLHPALHREDVMITQTLFKDFDHIVTKPMNTAQSIGVKKWKTPSSDAAWIALLETETQGFTSPVVVEEYLPMIDQGETRIWFAYGEFIAALKKFPAQGDFRVLIDSGSKVVAHTLTDEETIAARAVGSVLKKQGAALAAIDFIGGKISDYNITSPGLLTQLEQVHGGKNFAREIHEILLQH